MTISCEICYNKNHTNHRKVVKPLHPIAHIENAFQTKFGIPRQSGLVSSFPSKIIFEPEYRNPDAFRGLDAYSHLWLIWEFSDAIRKTWSPTVRPPRLGGNQRMGVFATRSPFRPNPIGLSVVTLDQISWDEPNAPILYVNGADLMNGTPIYDIKPYLPADLPYRLQIMHWRLVFRKNGWQKFHNRFRLPSVKSYHKTLARLISMTQSVCMDFILQIWRFALPCRTLY